LTVVAVTNRGATEAVVAVVAAVVMAVAVVAMALAVESMLEELA
jgi:hypothetical protein